SLSSLLGSGFSKYCSRRESGKIAAIRYLNQNKEIAGITSQITLFPEIKKDCKMILQSPILLSSEIPFNESGTNLNSFLLYRHNQCRPLFFLIFPYRDSKNYVKG